MLTRFHTVDLLARHAGVVFETEAIEAAVRDVPGAIEKPTLNKIFAAWRELFPQALEEGSITRLRRLGEEAKEINPPLSAYVLGRGALYDTDGLMKLEAGEL